MNNYKENTLSICSTNEAYECDSNYHNDDIELSDKMKDIQCGNFQRPIEKNRTSLSKLVPPVIPITESDGSYDSVTISGVLINAPSNENNPLPVERSEPYKSLTKQDLSFNNRLPIEGPESFRGLSNQEKSLTRLGFENMSLPNFRGTHSNSNRSNKLIDFKRDVLRSSALELKNSKPQLSVQTGDKFRKTSTFLISRKESNLSFTEDDLIDIKILDKPIIPELFIEFDSLHLNPSTNKYCWVERSRWLKFEEDYNSDTQRFDSPHLSPISIKGIDNFKALFSRGEAVLDCHHEKFINVLNKIFDSIIKCGSFSEKEIVEIRNAMILTHYHPGQGMKSSSSVGTMFQFDVDNQCFQPNVIHSSVHKRNPHTFGLMEDKIRVVSHVKLDRKLEPGTESLSVQVAALQSLMNTFSLFVRLDPPIKAEGLNEVSCPLRFLFMIFGPKYKEDELIEIGRVFSVMMSNPGYREIGYSAKAKEEFLTGIDAFIGRSVLVPINKIITHDSLAAMLPQMKRYFNDFLSQQNQVLFQNLQRRISVRDQDVGAKEDNAGLLRRLSANSYAIRQHTVSEFSGEVHQDKSMQTRLNDVRQCLKPLCFPFRYFYYDWIGLKSRYLSDFGDAFTLANMPIVFIGMIFIYFVVMVPAITFGALLNSINPSMTLTMMLLASGFFQFFYTLFGGQPLEIIGITGPVFAVEVVLSSLANYVHIELGAMRFWIGIYVAFLGLIFTTFNGVIIIQYIRVSVEEIYSFLVAAIYFLSALFYMFKAIPHSVKPIIANETTIEEIANERMKFGIGGVTLFLAFLMTNLCLILVEFKSGSFFSRQVRLVLGSLNVPIGIILIIAIEKIFFDSYNIPTLNVQIGNVLNMSLLFHIPSTNSMEIVSLQAHGLCFATSISLFAILTCEISTNSITASKSDRKLTKPSLYSINYFYILVLFPLLSGTLGWPFVSGAPVRSQANCMAMSIWSVNLPGIPPKVIGSAEQRISGIFVGAEVMLSIFLGSVLQHVPMAAMYGMFLYMGIKGAKDLIFTRRLISILQHRKYWHAHDYLKDYPTWNIVALVLIQMFFIAILIMLNCLAEFTTLKWTPLLFPVIILIFGFMRSYILPKWKKLNTHLAKMDRKHQIRLYADQHSMEQVMVTVEQTNSDIKVVKTTTISVADESSGSSSETDNK